MKIFRHVSIYFLVVLLLGSEFSMAQAAITVRAVKLFKDGNVCIKNSQGVEQSLNIGEINSNNDSLDSRLSSSGSVCTPPPFFTGGVNISSSGILTQAHPVVQALGRGILVSETAGTSGVSSSGNPFDFAQLLIDVSGSKTSSTAILQVTLPLGCDFIDDDDDIAGTSSTLTDVNDFSLPACQATNGFTIICNEESGKLTAMNGIEVATATTPAKMRFALNDFAAPDGNLIDSFLIKFDAQDIFCPSSFTGPLNVTVSVSNDATNPTMTSTLGTVDLGLPTKAAAAKFITKTSTSTKGQISTSNISTNAVLTEGGTNISNPIQIEELQEESIPIGGQSSASLINPPNVNKIEITKVNLWIIPSVLNLFTGAPSSSDISFSDNSLKVSSAPYLVMTNTDDVNAPFGSIVIPLEKNTVQGASDPTKVKTTITINNLNLAQVNSLSTNANLTFAFFETTGNAVVNTPGISTINTGGVSSNPVNYSAYGSSDIRAQNQNISISSSNAPQIGFASQINTENGLNLITSRSTVLESPQILNFTNVVSMVTDITSSLVSVDSDTDSIITVTGAASSVINGAQVVVDVFESGGTTSIDSVTVIGQSDGSFNAKLLGNFTKGSNTVKIKQVISGTSSSEIVKTVVKNTGEITIEPTVSAVLTFIQDNGGLDSIIAEGGEKLQAVVKAIKQALGLTD